MKSRHIGAALLACLGLGLVAETVEAGWPGHSWTDPKAGRFLERPYQPIHGRGRPFHGWSSNYRPYYYTPQSYANTPWDYGPCGREMVYRSAAAPQNLNAGGSAIPLVPGEYSAGGVTAPDVPSIPQAVPQQNVQPPAIPPASPTAPAAPATPTAPAAPEAVPTPADSPAAPPPPAEDLLKR